MIILDVEQGSPEWLAARVGIPTASQFSRIITPKTMKLSASADGYIAELVAEMLLDSSLDEGITQWMERGTDLEKHAIKFYEFETGLDVQKVGFCVTDSGLYGASPDGLVGEDGGLEIKCPSPQVHVENMLNMKERHKAQVQGGMMVTGRKWWDLLSYHPELPSVVVRYERDDEFIDKMNGALLDFLSKLSDAKKTALKWQVSTP